MKPGKLFVLVKEDNLTILSRELANARLCRPDEPDPLGYARCFDRYEAYGVSAAGLTVGEFAVALCAAGIDRHAIAALFPVALAKAGHSVKGAAAAAATPPAGAPELAPGARVLHPERGLLTVDEVNGADVVCRQFSRNGRAATLPSASVVPVPRAAPAAAWERGAAVGQLVGYQARWARLAPDVEAALEEAREAGRACVDVVVHNSETRQTSPCRVNLVAMVLSNLESGGQYFVRRTVAGPGGSRPLALSVLELADAVEAGTPVAVRGDDGRRAATARVLFVMDSNAKVEDAATGRKTFVPLDRLFSPDADLDAAAAEAEHVFDASAVEPLPLAEACLAERPAGTAARALGEMAAAALLAEYGADECTEGWQYRPGTEWTRYPGSVGARLAATFDHAPAGDAAATTAPDGPGRGTDALGDAPVAFLTTRRTTLPLRVHSSAVAVPLAEEAAEAGSAATAVPGAEGPAEGGPPPSEDTPAAADTATGEVKPAPTEVVLSLDELATPRRVWPLGPRGGVIWVRSCVDPQAGSEIALRLADGLTAALGADIAPRVECGDSAAAAGDMVLTFSQEVLILVGRRAGEAAGDPAAATGAPDGDAGDAAGPHDAAFVLDAEPGRALVVSAVSYAGLAEATRVLLSAAGRATAAADAGDCACLPAMYLTAIPLAQSRYRRIAIGATTAVQSAGQFLRLAAEARAHQPSMSRAVRLYRHYARLDGRLLLAAGHGLSTLVAVDAAAREATVQPEPAGFQYQLAAGSASLQRVRVPLSALSAVPEVPATGLPWDRAVFAQEAGGGAGGVCFVEFAGGCGAVVKWTDAPACEVASFRLGRLLGVRMPGVMALSVRCGEGARVVRQLGALHRDGRFRRESRGVGGGAKKALYIVVQELQRGRTLKDICHGEHGAAWAEATFGPPGALSEDGRRRLRDIGRLLAFDVLTHNSDRFYLDGIFSNFTKSGNMANVMFDPAGEVIAIDNAANAYDVAADAAAAAQFDEYRAAVARVPAMARARLSGPAEAGGDLPAHPALERVRTFFRDGQGHPGHAAYVPGLGYDIGDAGVRELERGFLALVERLRAERAGMEAAFARIEAGVRAELAWAANPVAWTADETRTRASFFAGVAAALGDA